LSFGKSSAVPDTEEPTMGNADLKFHPLADNFPLMEGQEFADLVVDIKTHGLHEPIVIFQGQILEGRNRYRACKAAGVSYVADNILDPEFDAVAYVVSKNIHRRHLTAEQKRDLIEKLLKAKPQSSDRTIAKQTKVDHKTVGKTRSKLEATGEIPQLKKTVGADGKSRPKIKKKPKKSVPTDADHHKVPPVTVPGLTADEVARAVKVVRPTPFRRRQGYCAFSLYQPGPRTCTPNP
jgi:hypothetical protein